MAAGKILVLGIDGATLDLILPWSQAGKLPVFRQLIHEGAYGKLRSTIIPSSAPAWTSFMTGKNPGKHGIFSFFQLIPGTYKIGITSGKQREGKTLWSILSEAGKSVGVLNVPMTYPAESVNGFNIAGYPSPSYHNTYFSYPRGFVGEIQETFGSYPAAPHTRDRILKGDIDGAIEELFEGLELRGKISRFLRNRDPLDFFCEVITETDQAQHFFWHLTDIHHPRYDPILVKRYGNVILSVYKKIDKLLGDILGELGREWTLIIMSDHGACVNHKGNSTLQGWLRNLGVLQARQSAPHPFIHRVKKLMRLLYPWVKDLSPRSIKDIVARLVPNLSLSVNDYMLGGTSFEEIAWNKTKAFWLWELLWVNLEGRQPMGIVPRGEEYERLRDYLIVQLLQARDYKTGQRVIREVFKKEEVFNGKYLEEAPDLQILWDESVVISGMTGLREGEQEHRVAFPREDDIRTGEHSLFGTLILWGRGIKKDCLLSNAEILDLSPTILHIMGQPIPSDMDGRVLTEAFESDFLRHPVRYEKAPREGSEGSEEAYDEEEMKEIREQLKGLGYLG
jgi:predicted AlkP superfamily phosphohydrolase/phosphomutase